MLIETIVSPIEKHSEMGESFGFYYQCSDKTATCSGARNAGVKLVNVVSVL
jgi:hypothetical protein